MADRVEICLFRSHRSVNRTRAATPRMMRATRMPGHTRPAWKSENVLNAAPAMPMTMAMNRPRRSHRSMIDSVRVGNMGSLPPRACCLAGMNRAMLQVAVRMEYPNVLLAGIPFRHACQIIRHHPFQIFLYRDDARR